MKPENWEKLPADVKREVALQLLKDERGQYVIGQALYKAIRLMKQVPEPFRERSNIEDMEILLEVLFPLGIVEELESTERLRKNEQLCRKAKETKELGEDFSRMRKARERFLKNVKNPELVRMALGW